MMAWLVRFFYFIGFEFSLKLIVIIHLFYIAINLKLQYDFHSILFEHPDILGQVTNLIEMIAPLLCHFTIVAESFTKKTTRSRLQSVQKEIQLEFQINQEFKFRKFLSLFVINTLVFVIILGMLGDVKGELEFHQLEFDNLIKFTDSLATSHPLDNYLFDLHQLV